MKNARTVVFIICHCPCARVRAYKPTNTTLSGHFDGHLIANDQMPDLAFSKLADTPARELFGVSSSNYN